MGDFEKRSASEAKYRKDAADKAMLAWNAAVIAWRNKTALPQSTFIFEVTRGVPSFSMALGPTMEAGFNDPFDLWNYVKSTFGATSHNRNVWANGKMLISVDQLLRAFHEPMAFAQATYAVGSDDQAIRSPLHRM